MLGHQKISKVNQMQVTINRSYIESQPKPHMPFQAQGTLVEDGPTRRLGPEEVCFVQCLGNQKPVHYGICNDVHSDAHSGLIMSTYTP